MQTKESIEKKIQSFKLEIDEIHQERHELLSKNGGILTEQNADMISDIVTLFNQIKILEWVLGNSK